LAKLAAKIEELMERNRLLSDIADMKSQHASRGANYYSEGGERPKNERRGLDPDASVKDEDATKYSFHDEAERVIQHPQAPSVLDDNSAYTGDWESTILSYDTSKKLEPESASVIVGPAKDDSVRKYAGEKMGSRSINDPDETDENTMSEPKLVKVPGGEYYGQLNERGQKHGDGKMKYDNGNEYDGQWKNNKRDGKGTTKYASGNTYTGSWRSGKRHGFGVFHIKKTGDVYRGNWAEGLKSGPGVYEYDDGELDVSFYKKDVRVGEGVRWSASRHQASRLVDGQLVGKEGGMPVEEAMELTKQLGFVV